MKKSIFFLLALFLLSANVSVSANSITSYYQYNGPVRNYSEAISLVQRKTRDKSKIAYYKPIKKHNGEFTILYYKKGNKKNSIEFQIRSIDHNKKVAVTNLDKLYQLPSNQHGKIGNGK